jgi:uncharacterized membrane protein YkvA (DUF1232 family)
MLKRLSVLWVAVRGDARRLWVALRHPEAPAWLKLGSAGLVLYLISPVDLLPDVVPMLGMVDDLVLIPLAMRWMLNRLPSHLRGEEDKKAGDVVGEA